MNTRVNLAKLRNKFQDGKGNVYNFGFAKFAGTKTLLTLTFICGCQ